MNQLNCPYIDPINNTEDLQKKSSNLKRRFHD